LKPLFNGPRWEELKSIIKSNKEKKEADYDKKLVAILDTIFTDDQKNRLQLSATAENMAGNQKKSIQ